MATGKKSFIIYCDLIDTIDHLTTLEKGKLFEHLLGYVNDKNPVLEDRVLLGTWKHIEQSLKRDLKKFEKIKEKRSEAGKESARLRALKKQQEAANPTSVESVKQIQQAATNPTVSDNVTVTDNVTDIINNNKYKNSVVSDLQFMEITAMQTKQTIPRLLQFLNTFEKHLIQHEDQKNNLKDFKTHFTNWINKQDLKKAVVYKQQRYV